jgi:intracellular sulfur oxidation DsrE/DsrF family protein
VALACNIAFDDCVRTVKSKDRVSDDEARKGALACLVPGVVLQPSGVFAAIRAQEAGCIYLRAS